MANRLSFFVPGNPLPKERPRFGKGKAYTSKKTSSYEKLVRDYACLAIAAQGYEMPDRKTPLFVVLHFYRADRRRADLDNLQKACLDALNKVAYEDDAQIEAAVMTVGRGYKGGQSGVQIEIRPYYEELSIVENLVK
jgi:Holliday junction resolvase RusA-like endonuclease